MIRLALQDIDKKYGNHTIFSFEKWDLDHGVYWLKGGNGTGKTTLFKMIAGQIPFEGMLTLNDISLKNQPVNYRSMISYAEAEPQYPSFITGNELLNYHIDVRNAGKEASVLLVEALGMSRFMDQKVGSYSSGMLKKLSLICAFVGDIQLYILDEPLITIDKDAAEVLYQLIKTYHEKGCSFLLSSHQELEMNHLPIKQVFKIVDRQLQPC
ncbi:ATP-binding cassette domain-containing protein [Pedobacter sp. PLR]|uniref:ABC transporter ATP-binding protein n=1 Tax=Pedobacter sp. PLR TaxID=2994465 RepID=UPI0022463F66|nr:ATP-binding cassette domain-containing protein [Pedobacter sp. PLR]MCX2453510.1 ATP-binding cassette domain-containing protein [Pedobacter sp. PLR]